MAEINIDPQQALAADHLIKKLQERIAVLENDAKYEGDENERRTLRYREDIAALYDKNCALSEQVADISIANMKANNFINSIGAVLRDYPYQGRDKALQMIKDWYSEGDAE